MNTNATAWARERLIKIDLDMLLLHDLATAQNPHGLDSGFGRRCGAGQHGHATLHGRDFFSSGWVEAVTFLCLSKAMPPAWFT